MTPAFRPVCSFAGGAGLPLTAADTPPLDAVTTDLTAVCFGAATVPHLVGVAKQAARNTTRASSSALHTAAHLARRLAQLLRRAVYCT